jgi:hypothetical protein
MVSTRLLSSLGANLRGDLAWVGLASDELLPSLSTLTNDVGGVSIQPLVVCIYRREPNPLLILALSGESELVLGLSVWDFVDTEPFVGGPQQTREVSLDILNIIQLGGQGVVDIDDDDLPVSLLLVKQGHDTEDLDLLDLARVSDQFTDLADIQWVVVALGLGLGVDDIGVLPGLNQTAVRSGATQRMKGQGGPYLRECTVVPEVTLVGEAVADEAQLALLDVLLDGVEEFLLGDLEAGAGSAIEGDDEESRTATATAETHLHLAIGPARDLNDHVQDGLLLVGVQRDIVEGRDGHAILLDVDAVLQRVGAADLAGLVGGRWRRHGGGG